MPRGVNQRVKQASLRNRGGKREDVCAFQRRLRLLKADHRGTATCRMNGNFSLVGLEGSEVIEAIAEATKCAFEFFTKYYAAYPVGLVGAPFVYDEVKKLAVVISGLKGCVLTHAEYLTLGEAYTRAAPTLMCTNIYRSDLRVYWSYLAVIAGSMIVAYYHGQPCAADPINGYGSEIAKYYSDVTTKWAAILVAK